MKFVMDNIWLVLIALASGFALVWPLVAKRMSGIPEVGAMEAVQLINREKAVVVDVCEAEEFAAGHVGGAKHIALNQLEERLPQLVKNKTLPLILVCQTGARAGRALAVAKKLGYEKAQSLAGGLSAWKGDNLPVEKG